VEKNNKILPIPETMQGISTSAESKEERSKKKKKSCFSSIASSTLMMLQMFYGWRSNPVQITIETTAMPIQLLPFPTVTICSPAYDTMGFIQR
jgi:hypothetical protein